MFNSNLFHLVSHHNRGGVFCPESIKYNIGCTILSRQQVFEPHN